MSEIDRIRKMAAAGTITPEEADRLIDLLTEIDHTEADVHAVAQAASTPTAPDMSRARTEPATGSPGPAGPAASGTSSVPTPGAAGATAGTAGTAAQPGSRSASGATHEPTLEVPADLSWFELATLAGDVDVRLDDSLDAPEVDGPEGVSVRPTDRGYEMVYEEGSSFIDRLLSGKIGRDFHVRLPAGMGLDLRIKAGDIDIHGVPYLKGHILAGDVRASGLRGIDLTMSAGDLDLSLELTEGEHRIAMTAGDMDVRLTPASHVKVTGRVNIGDAATPKDFDAKRSGLGESFSGTVGDGTATLEISQSTGDVNVSVRA